MPGQYKKPAEVFVSLQTNILKKKMFPDDPSGIQIIYRHRDWKNEPVIKLTQKEEKEYYETQARERYDAHLTNEEYAIKHHLPFKFSKL
jgi:hypothetical protein